MDATAPLAHAVRELAAPAELACAAWIEPRRILQWMFPGDQPAVHARHGHAAMLDDCARAWARMLGRLAERCARGFAYGAG